jgi:hypothetical protein
MATLLLLAPVILVVAAGMAPMEENWRQEVFSLPAVGSEWAV